GPDMRRAYIRRPSERLRLFDRLVGTGESVDSYDRPFDTYRDLMMFAACVGFEHNLRVPFDKTEHTIAWEQFASRFYFEGLIYVLGIASTEDADVLGCDKQEELIEAFEEYSNGGLEI